MHDEIDFPHFERASFGLALSTSTPLHEMDGFSLASAGVALSTDVRELNTQFSLPDAEVYTPEEIASYADYISDRKTGQLLHSLSQQAMKELVN